MSPVCLKILIKNVMRISCWTWTLQHLSFIVLLFTLCQQQAGKLHNMFLCYSKISCSFFLVQSWSHFFRAHCPLYFSGVGRDCHRTLQKSVAKSNCSRGYVNTVRLFTSSKKYEKIYMHYKTHSTTLSRQAYIRLEEITTTSHKTLIKCFPLPLDYR